MKNPIILLMKELRMNHLPHDCRHTTTMLDNANIDRTMVKLILGHSSSDITECAYTHKTLEQRVEAINMI